MKATLEIPDTVFRRAKSVAAQRGIPLREFVTEAVKDKLASNAKASQKPWGKHMGRLKHLRKESARINSLIEEHSGKIHPEMRRSFSIRTPHLPPPTANLPPPQPSPGP